MSLFQKIVLIVFISVPVLSSIISSIHLVEFFNLGNEPWISIILAVAFELGSIASFLALGLLKNVNKTMLWVIFSILVFMQIIGNVYYSFNYINQQLLIDTNWIKSAIEFLSMFGIYVDEGKMILSTLIGLPIPLISLFFLKSTSDYLNDIENNDDNDNFAPFLNN